MSIEFAKLIASLSTWCHCHRPQVILVDDLRFHAYDRPRGVLVNILEVISKDSYCSCSSTGWILQFTYRHQIWLLKMSNHTHFMYDLHCFSFEHLGPQNLLYLHQHRSDLWNENVVQSSVSHDWLIETSTSTMQERKKWWRIMVLTSCDIHRMTKRPKCWCWPHYQQ